MNLDDAGAAPLDHHRLDLHAARRVTYLVEQSFHYDYDAPVEALRHRLVVVPGARHGDLHRRAHRIELAGAVAQRCTRRDRAGNTLVQLHVPRVNGWVRFSLTAVLERVTDDGPPRLRHIHRRVDQPTDRHPQRRCDRDRRLGSPSRAADPGHRAAAGRWFPRSRQSARRVPDVWAADETVRR